MKPPVPENPIQPSRDLRGRVAFVACLVSLGAGIILTAVGAIARDLRLIALGIAALGMSGITREWLERDGRFDAALSGFERSLFRNSRLDAAQLAELAQLLREWDELESKRGSADFDPWAVQAVRHDIRTIVQKDPALEPLISADYRHVG